MTLSPHVVPRIECHRAAALRHPLRLVSWGKHGKVPVLITSLAVQGLQTAVRDPGPLVAQPAMQETPVQFPAQEVPIEMG